MKTQLLVLALFAQLTGLNATNDTCKGGDEPTTLNHSLIAEKKSIEAQLTSHGFTHFSKSQGKLVYEFNNNGTVMIFRTKTDGTIQTSRKNWKLTISKCNPVLTIFDPTSRMGDTYYVKNIGGNLIFTEDFTDKESVFVSTDQLEESTLDFMNIDLVGTWRTECGNQVDITFLFDQNGTFRKIANHKVTTGTWSISNDGQFLCLRTAKSHVAKKLIALNGTTLRLRELMDEEGCAQNSVLKLSKMDEKASL